MKYKTIAIITPVSHLDGIDELLKSKGLVYYLENGNKYEVRNLLLKTKANTILCNPNQQTYKIDSQLLDGTNVKLINSCSTGLNHIDLDYCKKNNIEIQCHKNDYELINDLPSTSELAFGLMMSLLRKIPNCKNHVSNYEWDYTQFMGRQVKDLKVGIIGYGRLGRMMAHYCDSFGADVRIYDPHLKNFYSWRWEIAGNEDYRYTRVKTIEEIFNDCDVISLHVHVTDETRGIINQELFSNIKKNCYIVNTSRGEIVNEVDVVNALKSGKLTGYATDVVENEFDDITKSPIIKAMNKGENIIVTPHIGGMTYEGQQKAYEWAINKL